MTVKKATTEMERVMSLLDTVMTDPVALIAEAPHLQREHGRAKYNKPFSFVACKRSNAEVC